MKIITRIILIAVIMTSIIFSTPLYASAIDSIFSEADEFLKLKPEDDEVSVTIDDSDIQKISNTVSGVLLTIAVGVTVISAVVMGINFTIQSIEDKAKIKESMVPWIIGIFISFGAFGIWKLTMSIFYGLQ